MCNILHMKTQMCIMSESETTRASNWKVIRGSEAERRGAYWETDTVPCNYLQIEPNCYYKTRQLYFLLQNEASFYYKTRQLLYYKMNRFHYKTRQVLHIMSQLLQNTAQHYYFFYFNTALRWRKSILILVDLQPYGHFCLSF